MGDDAVRLFLGDCREILSTTYRVNTVITDPVWPNAPAGLFPDVTDPCDLLRMALLNVDAQRVVIILRYDSDPRFLQAVPTRWPFFRAQVLPYVMPEYHGRKLGGMEIAYCFGEPLPPAPGRMVVPGWGPKAQPADCPPNGHPCSRAPIHLRWLVCWWSLPGEIVLDPFMGSGTTGVACVELGRRFVGIEIKESYFRIAQGEIALAQRRPPLPLPAANVQGELWGV